MKHSGYELLKNINCFLVDLDGTIYKGDLLLDGSKRLIDTIKEIGKDYLFVTNNSSINRSITAGKLTHIGLPTVKDKILTSGEATALYLERQHPGSRVFLIGTTALEEEFLTRGFMITDTDPDYIVLGFDTGLTYDKLWKLSELAFSGIPYIATNPDRTCLYEKGFMPEIAPMIAYVESASGKIPGVVIGKPNPIMAEIASEMTGYSLKNMAIIGDSLETDIPMGKNAGIPTILILTGDTLPGMITSDQPMPDIIFNDLNELSDALLNL
jgi:HAD superfamily hydrolase (TIGR01450 family)